MKKKSIWSRIGDFLMGKGFYMVLLLCVMAIGGSGYYLYQLAATDLEQQDQAVSAPAQVEVETGAQAVSDPEVSQELADALAQAEAEAQAAAAQQAQETQEAQQAQEAAGQQETAQQADPSAQETPSDPDQTAQAQEPAEDAVETEPVAQEPPAAQETLEPEAEPAQTTFAPPVGGETVAAFSDSELTYNAALEDWRTHSGVDLSAQLGDPVSAVLDGEVLSVTDDLLLGKTITLNHGNGLMTVYGNLAEDVAVEQGDTVTAGETLGCVGNTAAGEAHEGAWLHFAVEQDGVAVDPADYLE